MQYTCSGSFQNKGNRENDERFLSRHKVLAVRNHCETNCTSAVLMACTLKPLEMVPLSGNILLGNKSVEKICGLGGKIYFSCTCGDKGACVILPRHFTCGCQTHHHLLFVHRVNISVQNKHSERV